MSASFHLVRHAAHDHVGSFLAGRMPGVHLGAEGLAQAARLALRMRGLSFDTVLCSPRERTQETARAIADVSGAELRVDPALDEIDFGRWSGQTFEALNTDPEWRRWNSARSIACTPNGETMFDVQARAVGVVRRAYQAEPEGTHVLVTHADVIRALLCYVLGISLDRITIFDIAPASISTLVMDEWQVSVTRVNDATS